MNDHDFPPGRRLPDHAGPGAMYRGGKLDFFLGFAVFSAVIAVGFASVWVWSLDPLQEPAGLTPAHDAPPAVAARSPPRRAPAAPAASTRPGPAAQETPPAPVSLSPLQTTPERDSAYARQLVEGLAGTELRRGTITRRQAEAIHEMLRQLIAQGPAAIPAIRDFLNRLEDRRFAGPDGADLIDYPSLRLALIDALGQIGGPEAEQVLLNELRLTAEPSEILALADTLEWLAPGEHRARVLHSAQETLALISAEDFTVEDEAERVDAAPLFTLLQDYGDENVAAQLERAPSWYRQYATVALANLDGGIGVERLAKMAANPRRENRLALQLLTQVAVANPDAEAALLDNAGTGQIPDALWPRLGEVLSGDHQVQIERPDERSLSALGSVRGSNPYSTQTTVGRRQTQVLYSLNRSAGLTDAEVGRRLDLIDRLLAETDNTVAIEALYDARSVLQGRWR